MNDIEFYLPIITWSIMTYVIIVCTILLIIYFKSIKFLNNIENICNSCDINNKVNIIIDNLSKKNNKTLSNNIETISTSYNDNLDIIY